MSCNRREFLSVAAALGLAPGLAASSESMLRKQIPRSGEQLPVIGLGTYNVFDVESTPAEIAIRKKIVEQARILFNRDGFTGVSIDQIMAGVGLTRGGFYNHFKNKEHAWNVLSAEILRSVNLHRNMVS